MTNTQTKTTLPILHRNGRMTMAEIERQARQGKAYISKKTVTLLSLLPEWRQFREKSGLSPISIQAGSYTVSRWLHDMGLLESSPSQITFEDVNRWINRKGESGGCGSSRKVRLSHIRAFFFWALDRYCMTDPSRLVTVNYRTLSHRQKEGRVNRVKTFTDEEIARLLDHLLIASQTPDKKYGPQKQGKWLFWYIATVLGRYAGLREGDVCCLQRASVDDVPGKLIVWTGKRHKRVELSLPQILADALAMIPTPTNAAGREYCFPEMREMYLHRRSTIVMQFLRLCRAVGIQGRSFHGLRSTFATEEWKAGRSIPHIRRSLGHSSDETTEGYIDRNAEGN